MSRKSRRSNKQYEVTPEIMVPSILIKARSKHQAQLIRSIRANSLTFALGAAGAGKSHVAITLGLKALVNGEVQKLIIVRPAVEAGEKIGFLPGSLNDKMDPYVRPIRDIISKHLGPHAFKQLLNDDHLEISTLGYMRGRTLENCFVLFDEAQNATREQMEMFLTRLGFNAKFVICADPTQNDLRTSRVAVIESASILQNEEDVGIVVFGEEDVQRHNIVKTVIRKYGEIREKGQTTKEDIYPSLGEISVEETEGFGEEKDSSQDGVDGSKVQSSLL